MPSQLKSFARQSINSLLDPFGLELIRHTPYTDYRDYIPFEETLLAAKAAGLSVGDYIDVRHNYPGATQETIDQMAALGTFKDKIDRVCEIGPGSGRYLEKIVKICSPTYYEIYETASKWEKYLVETYQVVAHPTDGKSLAASPSESIDLVHAHKVMPGQPSLVMCRYFEEMVRIAKGGGKIVFDIVTEECLDDATLKDWFAAGGGYQHYPCLMPKQFAIDFFGRRGCTFVGSFFVPMKPGKTKCMVFAKK
jgi:hypothetical protein